MLLAVPATIFMAESTVKQFKMEMCNLGQRLVHGIDPGDDCRFFLDGPCWDDVDRRVLALRRVSLDFLCGALEK